jgi:hypothetical protein
MTLLGMVRIGDPDFDRLAGSIRCKDLSRLCLLSMAFRDNEWRGKIVARERATMPNFSDVDDNTVFAVTAKDVMDLLHISRRTAYDYRNTLRVLYG